MASLSAILNYLILGTAIPINLLAILLTLQHAGESSMNAYQMVLCGQFVFGIISVGVNCVGRMQLMMVKSHLIFHLDNFNFDEIGFNWYIFIIFINFGSMYLNIPSITLISVCRYLQVCKNVKLTKFYLIIGLFISFSSTFIISFFVWFSFDAKDSNDILQKEYPHLINGNLELTKDPKSVFLSTKKSNLYILMVVYCLYYAFNYAIIIGISISFRRYIKLHYATLTPKTRAMNDEFSRILYWQSFSPSLLSGLPDVVFFVVSILEVQTFGLGTTLIPLLISVSIVNAFLFIVMASKNRKLLHLYYLKGKGILTGTKISIQQGTTIQQAKVISIRSERN